MLLALLVLVLRQDIYLALGPFLHFQVYLDYIYHAIVFLRVENGGL